MWGGVITSTGRRERSISRVVTVPSTRRATGPRLGRADDDQVGLLLLGEHEDPAHDRARRGRSAVRLARRLLAIRSRDRAVGRLGAAWRARSAGAVESASSSSPSSSPTATSAPDLLRQVARPRPRATAARRPPSRPPRSASCAARLSGVAACAKTATRPDGVPSGTFHTVGRLCRRSSSTPIYSPTADQPAAIDGIAEAVDAGARGVDAAGRHRHRQDDDDGGDDRAAAAARRSSSRTTRRSRPSSATSSGRTSRSNSVEYFVSYYDYYQPEAYVPSRDLYIEKDSAINQEIDRLRHAATASLFARRDVVIVASVSCIFGLGSPETYNANCQVLVKGGFVDRDELLRKLVSLQYNRNDQALGRGTFRVRGDTLEVFPAYEETAFRAMLFGDEVERLQHFDPLTGELILDDLEHVAVWPATHYNVQEGRLEEAVAEIGRELNERCAVLEAEGKLLESHRLRQRTQYDMEMLREVGFCSGIENYSRILDARAARLAPVLPARLLPERLRLLHRRVPPDRAADRRHARGRPLAQADARRLRLPAAERARQPAADVRRVPRDRAAARVRVGDARPVRARRTRRAWSSRSSGRPASSTRRSRCARRATRSTT